MQHKRESVFLKYLYCTTDILVFYIVLLNAFALGVHLILPQATYDVHNLTYRCHPHPIKSILSSLRLTAKRLVSPGALLHQDLRVTMHRRHESHPNPTANSLSNPSLVSTAQSRIIRVHNPSHRCHIFGEHREILYPIISLLHQNIAAPHHIARGKHSRDTRPTDPTPTHQKHPPTASPSSSTSSSPPRSNHAARTHPPSSSASRSAS